jgi:hypothetical protein
MLVFWFLTQIGPNAPTNMTKSIFEASSYNTESNQIKLEYFEKLPIFLHEKDFRTMTLEQIEKRNLVSKNFMNIIDQLFLSANLEEFKRNTIGLLSESDLSTLTKVMESFAPIYKELIYLPNEDNFNQKLSSLQKSFSGNEISSYFEKANTFLPSFFASENPVKILLYPTSDTIEYFMPIGKNQFIYSFQNTEYQPEKLLTSFLSNLFFNFSQGKDSRNYEQIRQLFKQNPSIHSIYASSLLYRTLYTVLANGYNNELQQGDLFQLPENEITFVNEFGKAIFPKVLDYINQNKVIDKPFVDDFIKIYENSFSAWTNDFEFMMLSHSCILPDTSYFDQWHEIYPNAFYSYSWNGYNFYSDLISLPDAYFTKVVIINTNHKYNLKTTKKLFPELEDWEYDPTQEFIKIQFLNDRTNLVIINQRDTPLKELLAGYSSK